MRPLPGRAFALGCLGSLFLCSVALFLGLAVQKKKVEKLEERFEEMGLRQVQDATLDVAGRVVQPTYYRGHVFRLDDGASVPIGFICLIAELDGVYDEKVYFMGQAIRIRPGAQLNGGLEVTAKYVENLGKIAGEPDGEWDLYTEQPLEKEGIELKYPVE